MQIGTVVNLLEFLYTVIYVYFWNIVFLKFIMFKVLKLQLFKVSYIIKPNSVLIFIIFRIINIKQMVYIVCRANSGLNQMAANFGFVAGSAAVVLHLGTWRDPFPF